MFANARRCEGEKSFVSLQCLKTAKIVPKVDGTAMVQLKPSEFVNSLEDSPDSVRDERAHNLCCVVLSDDEVAQVGMTCDMLIAKERPFEYVSNPQGLGVQSDISPYPRPQYTSPMPPASVNNVLSSPVGYTGNQQFNFPGPSFAREAYPSYTSGFAPLTFNSQYMPQWQWPNGGIMAVPPGPFTNPFVDPGNGTGNLAQQQAQAAAAMRFGSALYPPGYPSSTQNESHISEATRQSFSTNASNGSMGHQSGKKRAPDNDFESGGSAKRLQMGNARSSSVDEG